MRNFPRDFLHNTKSSMDFFTKSPLGFVLKFLQRFQKVQSFFQNVFQGIILKTFLGFSQKFLRFFQINLEEFWFFSEISTCILPEIPLGFFFRIIFDDFRNSPSGSYKDSYVWILWRVISTKFYLQIFPGIHQKNSQNFLNKFFWRLL